MTTKLLRGHEICISNEHSMYALPTQQIFGDRKMLRTFYSSSDRKQMENEVINGNVFMEEGWYSNCTVVLFIRSLGN